VVRTEQKKVLVIPATAVLYAPYGDSVFVIDEKKDAQTGQVQKILRQQFVRLGLARGDLVTITSNLNPGDTVVTSGVFKLRPGLPVEVDNKLAPDAQAAPKPDNT
jgi:membrane fusion protein (multidrug efflux system)